MKRMTIIFCMITMTFILNACNPEVDYYTISFDPQGGTNVVSQVHRYGDLAIEPKEPTKEEHNFIGWYTTSNITEESIEYDFSKKVTEDIVLYAYWEEIIYDTYTDIVETDYAVFEVEVDTISLVADEDFVAVTVTMTAKKTIHHDLYTQSYGEEGMIEISIINKLDDSVFLYDENFNRLVDSGILDVTINKGESITRTIHFSPSPIFEQSNTLDTAPSGEYIVSIASRFPYPVYIFTNILIHVN